jgi:hypothetical protein
MSIKRVLKKVRRPPHDFTWHKVVILVTTLVLMVATGCIGQSANEKIRENATSSVLIISSTPTQIQSETTQVPQEGYWIKIDPINDTREGDIFTINSITNLPAGDEILVQIYSATFHTHPPGVPENYTGAMGYVRVIPGRNGINTISFTVNSSTIESTIGNSSTLYPDEYVITEEAVIKNATVVALFSVTPRKTFRE